jgi:Protein of unknown function (DUF2971)
MSPPDFLYKYQSLSVYSLTSLINNTIWLAMPNTFNDPFDCALVMDSKMVQVSHNEEFENLQNKIREVFPKLGICSFSAVPNLMLMWSHYANNHNGFCVEYDCREGTTLRDAIAEVCYEDKLPCLGLSDFHDHPKEAIETLWRTKAKCWSYEQEWRFVSVDGNKNHQGIPVTSIIFGLRMPVHDRNIVYQALRQKNILFKETILKEGEFAIEIIDLEISKLFPPEIIK